MKPGLIFLFAILLAACQQNSKRNTGVKFHTSEIVKKAETVKTVPRSKAVESNFSDDTVISRTWNYKNLSPDFNYRIYLRVHVLSDWAESQRFDVMVMDKQDSILQKISVPGYTGMSIFGGDFPVYVRSYQTGIGTKRERINGYYGHFIVQDFNLDSLYDFATVKSIPMSGTPIYTFYFQNENGRFEKSRYMTKEIRFYPEVDRKKRMLIAQSYTGCCMFYWDYYAVDTPGSFHKIKSVEKDVSGD